MKNNKGVTLVSLLLYVCVLIIMLSIMSIITTEFYNNTEDVQEDVQEIIEFNKFNSYFLKEVKTKNNKVDTVGNNYILFTTGNSFKIDNNIIYFNNVKVCEKVKTMNISLHDNGDKEDNIIEITLEFKHFIKTIRYTLENIY